MSRGVHLVAAAFAVMLLLCANGCGKKKGLRITGIEPTSGPYTGGTTVNIKGSGFQEGGAKGVKVYFGGGEAKVIGWIGDDTLKVESPAVKPEEVGKSVDVLLVFDDARDLTIEKAFTYEEVNKGFSVDALTEGGDAVE